MTEQAIANILDALGVLPAAAAELSPSARKQLEAAAEREAPNMSSEGREATLRGCEKLNLRIPTVFLKKHIDRQIFRQEDWSGGQKRHERRERREEREESDAAK
jgi:hypothetical protein